MKTVVSSLHFQIPTGDVPDWVHLTPAGTFSGVDGRGPFRLEDAAAVIADSMKAGKLPIDENHATDTAAPHGRPSPARGWIVAMEARSDGLWGKVEWTSSGRDLLADKAYRGISPVLLSTKADGRVLKVLRAALTNDPNLPLTTLHRSEPMDFLAKLRQALGLKGDAAEDAVLAAVTSHAATVAAHVEIATAAGLKADATPAALLAQVTAHAADAGKLAAIAAHFTAAGLDLSKLTPKDLETQLQARGAGAGDAELRRTVITLQAQLTTLQAEAAKEKAIAFVDAAIAAGKPIRPLRDHYIARHQKDAAAVETEINALVSIHGGSVKAPRSSEPGALDGDEQSVVALMGLDPKKFAETKAELEKSAL